MTTLRDYLIKNGGWFLWRGEIRARVSSLVVCRDSPYLHDYIIQVETWEKGVIFLHRKRDKKLLGTWYATKELVVAAGR